MRNSLFVAGRLSGHHALFFEFLLTDFLGASGLGGAGDGDLTLGENNLNVTWGSHVGINATMGTVGTSTLLGGGVDLIFIHCYLVLLLNRYDIHYKNNLVYKKVLIENRTELQL